MSRQCTDVGGFDPLGFYMVDQLLPVNDVTQINGQCQGINQKRQVGGVMLQKSKQTPQTIVFSGRVVDGH